MSNAQNKRKNAFANKMHREIFTIVFLATIFPTIIAVILVYYLIFSITADYVGIPEVVAQTVIPAAQRVMTILFIATPITLFAVLLYASNIAHKIIGPFDRIVNDLDGRLSGKEAGPIRLRKDDKFQPLVEKINTLLTRCEQSDKNEIPEA